MKHIPMYLWTITAFILCGLFTAGLSTNMVEGWEVPLRADLAAFIFQFVLTFIVSLYTGFWEDLDLFTRSTQPFANSDTPQPADENLLLEYNCALPYIVTYTALTKKHYKIARVSALAPLQPLLPIMVAGSISVVDNGNYTCRCTASIFLFIAIILWLLAYVFLIPYEVLEAGYDRHLPRNYRSIADILSWTYASRILRQGDLLDIDVRHEYKRQRWYMQAKLQMACKKYSFGMYKSTTHNDVWCFGIDEDSTDTKHITPPDVGGLLLLPCIRQRGRRNQETENGDASEEMVNVINL